jgi:hypothetical protein
MNLSPLTPLSYKLSISHIFLNRAVNRAGRGVCPKRSRDGIDKTRKRCSVNSETSPDSHGIGTRRVK